MATTSFSCVEPLLLLQICYGYEKKIVNHQQNKINYAQNILMVNQHGEMIDTQ